MHEDTPCSRVFVARDGLAWIAYVDGVTLHEDSGNARSFANASVAYAAACAAAPQKGHP